MTKEELKQEAEAEADKVIIGSGMDRTSVIHLKHLLVTMYLQGAEPREKRIAELEDKLANADYQLEGRDLEIKELKAQIEKMKKYGKLLQDICDVMGNDPYMVWRGLEQRVLILWDKSEEEKGLKMAENILDRLLKIKPQDWAEIDKWEIKENE